MPRNVYFSHGTTAEKSLYEDLIIESLKIYGTDCYYIPRKIVNENAIFNEDALSEFGEAFMIEAYVENLDGFAGEGDILSKFGLQVRDQVDLVISDRRWKELIGRFDVDALNKSTRPREGDLIYFPLVNGLFEIAFVEDETPFYQLANIPTFKLSCNLFEYNNQVIDTGVEEIDEFETTFAQRVRLTLGSGATTSPQNITYNLRETVTQVLGDASPSTIISGEVATVGTDATTSPETYYIDVVNIVTSTDSPERTTQQFVATAGAAGNLIGTESGASWNIVSIEGFNTMDDNDPFADNVTFENIGNNFLNFDEKNPFGEVNITT